MKKGRFILGFLVALSFCATLSSCKGSTGPTGPTGSQGIQGVPGENETDGVELKYFYEDTLIETVEYKSGTKVNLSSTLYKKIEKSGYLFSGWYSNKNLLGEPLQNITLVSNQSVYAKVISPYQAAMIHYENVREIKNTNFYLHFNSIIKKTYLNYSFLNYDFELDLTDGYGTFVLKAPSQVFDTTTNTLLPAGTILQHGNIEFYLNYSIGSQFSRIELSSCFVEVEYYYNSSFADYQNARSAMIMGFSCFGDNANCLPLARTFKNYNLYLIEENN